MGFHHGYNLGDLIRSYEAPCDITAVSDGLLRAPVEIYSDGAIGRRGFSTKKILDDRIKEFFMSQEFKRRILKIGKDFDKMTGNADYWICLECVEGQTKMILRR